MRDPGGLCDRKGQAGRPVRGVLRYRAGAARADSGRRARGVRPATGRDYPRSRPASADLRAHGYLRAFRSGGTRLPMGDHGEDGRAAGGRRTVTARLGERARSGSTAPRTGAVQRKDRPTAPATRVKQPLAPTTDLPVARVAVDVSLPHLDRLFDYLVPESMATVAVPGCRVKVRFSGRLVAGYLVERAAVSEHCGQIAYLHRVVSAEPVLTGEMPRLAGAVAGRYG